MRKSCDFPKHGHIRDSQYPFEGGGALGPFRVSQIRRAPHELFPKKGVPHQFPAGLEILRKCILAWGFDPFGEHLFDNFSIFTIYCKNNYFEID